MEQSAQQKQQTNLAVILYHSSYSKSELLYLQYGNLCVGPQFTHVTLVTSDGYTFTLHKKYAFLSPKIEAAFRDPLGDHEPGIFVLKDPRYVSKRHIGFSRLSRHTK